MGLVSGGRGGVEEGEENFAVGYLDSNAFNLSIIQIENLGMIIFGTRIKY